MGDDYCEVFPQIGNLVRQVRSGTELPEDLVESLGVAQTTLRALAEDEPDSEAATAMHDAADATGRLRLSVADAGTDYPFERVVRLRGQALSITLLTASLRVGC